MEEAFLPCTDITKQILCFVRRLKDKYEHKCYMYYTQTAYRFVIIYMHMYQSSSAKSRKASVSATSGFEKGRSSDGSIISGL